MKIGERQTRLIADFVKGYADGWYMAVKECYRNQLDIKLMERKRKNQSCLEWTQGPYFSFAEGHLFYNTPNAYTKWEQAIQDIEIACQITYATPTILDKNKKLVEGTVKFTLYKPDKKSTSLLPFEDHQLPQKEFVNFLKTGVLRD